MPLELIVAVCMAKLPFVDEAAKDGSFLRFRTSLIAALEKKNYRWVDSRLDPNIRYTFGDNDGKKGFMRQWGSDRERLAREFLAVLRLGGSFDDRMFWAPYVHSTWPESMDPFESMAVVSDKVPMTGSGGATVATLSYDIVQVGNSERDGLVAVTFEGKSGWVARKFLRSPIDYRAGFTKVKGSWRISAFIAGD